MTQQLFGKIFQQIYESSVCEDWMAMVTFQQMIVLADKDGIVDMTPQAIHRRTNIPLDIIEHGIRVLESEDSRSRSPLADGRRIIRLDEHRDWGWKIVNYALYLMKATQAERNEVRRLQMQELRQEQKEQEKQARPISSDSVTGVLHKDVDVDKDKDGKKTTRKRLAVRPDDVSEDVWADFQILRKSKRSPLTITALEGIKREASKASISLEEALSICCIKGWQAFNASWNWQDAIPGHTQQGNADLEALWDEAIASFSRFGPGQAITFSDSRIMPAIEAVFGDYYNFRTASSREQSFKKPQFLNAVRGH